MDNESDIDRVFPPKLFGSELEGKTFDRNDLFQMVNNSIDASKFGNESSQYAMKNRFKLMLREILDERKAKEDEGATVNDYLQVSAWVKALAKECRNASKRPQGKSAQEYFNLLSGLLLVLIDIGSGHMNLTERDFKDAELSPQDYQRLLFFKEKGIQSALGRNLPPSSGVGTAGQKYTWAVLPPQFYSEENEALINSMIYQPSATDAPTHSDQLSQRIVKEPVMPETAKNDVIIEAVPYTSTIGYEIMCRRAELNLTEEQLASQLNQKIEVNTARKEHVLAWQENENLEMLSEDNALYAALKYVLIEQNDRLNQEQKERMLNRFDKDFEETLKDQMLSTDEQDLVLSPFGSFLNNLRTRIGLSEKDLAIAINSRLTDVLNSGWTQISKDDVVDFQAGIKLPDEQMLARLDMICNLDPTQASEADKKSDAKKGVRRQTIFGDPEVVALYRSDVLAPLKAVYDDHNLSAEFHKHRGFLYSRPFLESVGRPRSGSGNEQTPKTLAEAFNQNRIEVLTAPLRNAGVDPAIYEPIMNSWRALQTLNSEASAAKRRAGSSHPTSGMAIKLPSPAPGC